MIEQKLKELEELEEEYQSLSLDNDRLRKAIAREKKEEEKDSPKQSTPDDENSDPRGPMDDLMAATPAGMIPSLEWFKQIMSLFKMPSSNQAP